MALTEEDLQEIPAEGIDTEIPGKYAELLSDLQGNILRGHGRDHTVHLFLQFKPNQVQPLKEWIKIFAQNVTSAQKQATDAVRFRKAKIAGDLFINFFLSRKGYEFLEFKPFQIPGDQPFRFGMKNDAVRNLLGDPVIEEWDTGLQGEIHALLLIADDSLEKLQLAIDYITEQLEQLAQVVHRENGFILRNDNGDIIEHFGFIDGISQPLFLKRDIERVRNIEIKKIRESNPNLSEEAIQELIKELDSKWNPRAPLSLLLAKDPNGKLEDSYGSYLVYRKLEQDVNAFRDAQAFLAKELGDIDQELAGALTMGRFRDGTPLTLSSTPAKDETNNFDYSDDQQALKCPFHSHVRKSNPRGDTGRVVSSGESFEQALEKERNHRIARRGISYGESDLSKATSTGSGLLFLCFQADIENQFNFIQAAWSNPNNFVQVNVGTDPIIGQAAPDARNQKWPIKWGEPETKPGFNFQLWVHLKGGEYFFAPSISSLKNI
ncbi:Dyp-type peroxidase [Cylindrospermum sp. FACHB-282]|uniref:Dyp-type peroxidase n=1 Tax=Cylindrospermum sp. FACHB-282 TaxID=2692794 RepID=UPI0016872AC0|nr:Dyp-type peroxidase domain-containing protein [Cylindrospermum sp. FACHB-282]MBD2386122.1 Dyp-type peroxidase [Cylindrospermum sp. FACHB-282]